MKIGLFITGIILMILGAVAFVYVQSTLSDCASFMGQLDRFFSGRAAQKCLQANYLQLGGAVIFVIGIGLTIGGAVSKR